METQEDKAAAHAKYLAGAMTDDALAARLLRLANRWTDYTLDERDAFLREAAMRLYGRS